MDAELVKKRLRKRVLETIEKFQAQEDITCSFGEPEFAYVSVDDVRFDMLFARGLNGHPREIYRPGRTIILYYIPLADEIVKANEESAEPTEEWVRAYYESLWLAMYVNQTIREVMVGQGRLISNLSNMVEWDDEKCQEGSVEERFFFMVQAQLAELDLDETKKYIERVNENVS